MDLTPCLIFASDNFVLLIKLHQKCFFRVATFSANDVPFLTLRLFFKSEADETEAYILPQRLTFYQVL